MPTSIAIVKSLVISFIALEAFTSKPATATVILGDANRTVHSTSSAGYGDNFTIPAPHSQDLGDSTLLTGPYSQSLPTSASITDANATASVSQSSNITVSPSSLVVNYTGAVSTSVSATNAQSDNGANGNSSVYVQSSATVDFSVDTPSAFELAGTTTHSGITGFNPGLAQGYVVLYSGNLYGDYQYFGAFGVSSDTNGLPNVSALPASGDFTGVLPAGDYTLLSAFNYTDLIAYNLGDPDQTNSNNVSRGSDYTFTVGSVPEPSSATVFGLGIAALLGSRRARRRRPNPMYSRKGEKPRRSI